MVALGTELPSFALPDLGGKTVSDRDFANAPALVVAFICPHCPYVKHVRRAFVQLAKDYQPHDVAIVAINANDANAFPEDDPVGMAREASAAAFTFPLSVPTRARRLPRRSTPHARPTSSSSIAIIVSSIAGSSTPAGRAADLL